MTLVAPARYALTRAHIRRDAARTLCGQPLAEDELWQELPADPGVPVCAACLHVQRRDAPLGTEGT